MNEQPQGAQLSSTYPLAPMDYVNMYTNENIKSGKAPPPPPIIKDNYTCFGKPIDPNDVLIRPLESQGFQRLYSTGTTTTTTTTTSTSIGTSRISTNNHKRELKKLNHSIVIAYLDLLEILIKAPTKQVARDQQQQLDLNSEQLAYKTLRDQKLEDIELLFINMHHLINELRPHQARDNIRCILEMQKRQRIETAQKFKTHLFKIVEILKLCIQSIQSPNNNTNSNNTNTNLKSDVFIDELNELMSSAHKLTKTLDSIDLISNNNNNNKKSKLIDECNTNQTDVDMIQEDDLVIKNTQTNTDLINLNKNSTTKTGESSQEVVAVAATAATSAVAQQSTTASACDYKDLILCDLIDDFLLKENEF